MEAKEEGEVMKETSDTDKPSCVNCRYSFKELCVLKGFYLPPGLSMNMSCKDYVKRIE